MGKKPKPEAKKYILLIEEECGYAHHIAFMSERELKEAKRRWKSMRGLNCLVPVTFVFPQAQLSSLEEWRKFKRDKRRHLYAHVHQADDSFFDALPKYKIPEALVFEMSGRFSVDELCQMLAKQRLAYEEEWKKEEEQEKAKKRRKGGR